MSALNCTEEFFSGKVSRTSSMGTQGKICRTGGETNVQSNNEAASKKDNVAFVVTTVVYWYLSTNLNNKTEKNLDSSY